jgi:hypothetical protein
MFGGRQFLSKGNVRQYFQSKSDATIADEMSNHCIKVPSLNGPPPLLSSERNRIMLLLSSHGDGGNQSKTSDRNGNSDTLSLTATLYNESTCCELNEE